MLSFIAARMKLIVNTVAIPRPTRSEPSRSSIQKLTQERITTQMQGMYIWKMKYTDRRWNLMVVVRPEKVSGEEAETQWEVCSVLTLCHTLHRVVAVQLDRRRGVMNALIKGTFYGSMCFACKWGLGSLYGHLPLYEMYCYVTFTPKIDKFQTFYTASPKILHHTVWRTWLFMAYPDERRLYYQFLLNYSILTKQDWHYARILGLAVCKVVRIISTKNRSSKARHDLPHPACTFVCDMSGLKLRKQRHRGNESAYVNILLSSAMTMGSTSCKPSQDVSKRSPEQIQPSPSRPPKNKKPSVF